MRANKVLLIEKVEAARARTHQLVKLAPRPAREKELRWNRPGVPSRTRARPCIGPYSRTHTLTSGVQCHGWCARDAVALTLRKERTVEGRKGGSRRRKIAQA